MATDMVVLPPPPPRIHSAADAGLEVEGGGGLCSSYRVWLRYEVCGVSRQRFWMAEFADGFSEGFMVASGDFTSCSCRRRVV